ncbi:MarR family transcriptional regulator [Paenibacillus sp. MER 180]|uniref:DNA-binding transcriptional regulator, MarR family n=1 Tax=Paenibacillus alvei TaxID=44250 RepID=A0A383R520_PAEAL|nr:MULTISPECIES: MarR family transcriptional regulator [Paenibacillus]MCM3292185.1 MarR family transcriptional regulator [Paenibacillus sp. MER 180]SDF79839.1 DNA-binding transcriptional regulator, MarR family [Paenibacillus sp. cl6col]SYX81923.1 DNA-binding transcriptional regulator, MarR family [Paenibacillus alvei]
MPNREQLLQLQMNFRSMLRGMRTQWDRHLELHNLNVNMTQFAVLNLLFRNGAMKVTDVAKELRLTPGAVTGITDKLTLLQYVTRNRDALDRRINYLELTEAGHEKVKAVEIQREIVFSRFFEGIPDEELLHFIHICQQVNLNLDEISQVGE